MGKFKVGDKVRLTEDYSKWVAGTESVIEQILAGDSGDDDLIYTDKVRGAFARRFELVPAWQPKVGDRVLMKPDSAWACDATVGPGTVFPAEKEGRFIVKFDVDNGFPWNVSVTDIEPLPVATEAQLAQLAEAPAWTPKVGDRVVSDDEDARGEIGTVVEGGHNYKGLTMVKFDTWRRGHDGVNLYGNTGKDHWLIKTKDLQPAPAPVIDELAPLTITAGRYYKTRDGRKVGPLTAEGDNEHYPFRVPGGAYGKVYIRKDGTANIGMSESDSNLWDLIAEWVDEPAEQPAVAVAASNDNAAPAKFKVGDVVRPSRGFSKNTATITKVISENDISVSWNDGAFGSTDGWTHWELELVVAPAPTAIVALIENGVAKPATRPYVHASEAEAVKEAERLAGIHRGKRFGIYVLADTREADEPAYGHTWQNLAARGEKIAAIKELRAITGMGLKPAKDAVEYFLAAA